MRLFIEIIVYRLKPGTGSLFHQVMLKESIPLHRSAGIEVVDSRPSATDPDSYCLIRAFESLAAVGDSQERFYASAAWREGPRQRIVDCIETSSKAVLEMPASQVRAWAASRERHPRA